MEMLDPEVKESTEKLFWDIIYQTDWTELWLLSVQSFHVLILCFIILSHRAAWNNVSGIVFISLLALMYLAPTINSYAAENYLKFAKEQYFDSNGMFISLIVSLPCAINCILFIVSWLVQSWNLMVEIKAKQIQYTELQKKK